MKIDVCIPTQRSGGVIAETLDKLAVSVGNADVRVETIRVVDDDSDDDTVPLIRDAAARHGWRCDIDISSSNLPEARTRLIHSADTDWFLFLDDDVRLARNYLRELVKCRMDAAGAVQGRKRSRTEHPSDWVRRRSRRAGTHATLIRTEAVDGISIPIDVEVLEDEWIRRYVESNGYIWVFNHQAEFVHDCQERHPIGWREGRVAGKYGLKPFHECALNIPYALLRRQNPLPHTMRAAGWVYGSAEQRVVR